MSTAEQTPYLGLSLINPDTDAVRDGPASINSNMEKLDSAAGNPPCAIAFCGTETAIPAAKFASIPLTVQYASDDSMKPTQAHPTRITVPQTGIYDLAAGVSLKDVNPAVNIFMDVRGNGDNDPNKGYRVLYGVAMSQGPTGSGPRASTCVPISAGSYIELFVSTSGAAPAQVALGQGLTFLNITFMRPVAAKPSDDIFKPTPNTPIQLPYSGAPR